MKNKLIILSLSPLFFLTFIQNFPWDKYKSIYNNCFNIAVLLEHKCLIVGLLICVLWMIASTLIYFDFRYFFKYGRDSGFTIIHIEEDKSAGLNFFLALILPMMTNEIEEFNKLVSFCILIFIIIMLLSKTNLYYQNPILIIAGYRVYKFKFHDNPDFQDKECIGISLSEVTENNSIEYKKIEENILIIKRMR